MEENVTNKRLGYAMTTFTGFARTCGVVQSAEPGNPVRMEHVTPSHTKSMWKLYHKPVFHFNRIEIKSEIEVCYDVRSPKFR